MLGIYLGPSPHCPLPACHKPVIVLGARANLYEVEHPDDQPAKFRIRAEHGYVLHFDLAYSRKRQSMHMPGRLFYVQILTYTFIAMLR